MLQREVPCDTPTICNPMQSSAQCGPSPETEGKLNELKTWGSCNLFMLCLVDRASFWLKNSLHISLDLHFNFI